MADLLLELFSEEIPARMQADALAHLQDKLSALAGKSEGFVTPRRVAVWVKDLPDKQPDVTTELKGPKLGAPEAALQGFLKKNNLAQSDLVEKDGVYFATVHQKGQPTADLIKTVVEKTLAEFPWPKSMRWGSGETTWVRPLHSIICLFDGKVIPVEFSGVKAGNTTRGHRFLSSGGITISSAADYEAQLEKAHVIASRDKRKASILRQAQSLASACNLQLATDNYLLEEITGLVEWPVLLTGTIDAKFMDLPEEVLVSEMRAHQKYFALENTDGSLSDTFLITSNMETADGGTAIIAGNERVLRARLSDGRFFWDQDRKKSLEQWAEVLKNVTFHAKLGTVADKVERIKALAAILAPYCHPAFIAGSPANRMDIPQQVRDDVERAADLCKADLVTGMVGEFPELQGVMGRYYAQAQKENPAVADAIRDHYLPLGPSSPVPTQPVSICIALADKLDTLISMFAIGEKPTGSKDPFALRRAALGAIRIVLENNLRLPLHLVIPAKAGSHLSAGASGEMDSRLRGNDNELLSFITDRLKVQLKDQGIHHDVIAAVVADGDDDLVRVVARAKAVQDFLGTENGVNLLAAYKRAANIVGIEEKKDKITYSADKLNPNVLQENEEKKLSMSLGITANILKELRINEQFTKMMEELATLRSSVDAFFDKVMVNCEDKELRAQRLRLLARIRDTMDSIANFALIEG